MSTRFPDALKEARRSGRVLLDLAEEDPARCGLGWDPVELAALEERRGVTPATALRDAREAIAGYLAGHGAAVPPDRVLPVRSRAEGLRLVLEALCQDAGGEVLIPSPQRPYLEAGAFQVRGYPLEFDERWRLDRRVIQRALSPRVRALVVGNPADPTGAAPSPEDLRFLEALCGERSVALIGDEPLLDSTLDRPTTVARATACLAVHLGGLRGICGLSGPEGDWLAVAGPEALTGPLVARLAAQGLGAPSTEGSRLPLLPPLLGRREAFLSRLRARLVRNRSALAAAALREAPWTLQWGGGWWAVLQINPVRSATELCLALLAQGVAVQPGHLGGLPESGTLLVSLLPVPDVFDLGLEKLEERLRDRIR